MKRILGLLLVPFLLVGLIWLAAVIYLQQDSAQVDGDVLLLHFVYLPLAAVAVWFTGKMAIAKLKRVPTCSVEQAAPPAAPSCPQQSPPRLPRAILAAELSTPSGDSAELLLPELREGMLRPELSGEIVSAEGLPVCCSRHGTLDTDQHLDWLNNWLLQAAPDHPALSEAQEDGSRLLALLNSPLERCLEVLAALPPLGSVETTPAGTTPPHRTIQIKLFAPPAWQDMLATHIRERLNELSGFAIGFIRHDAQRPELHHDPIRVADAFALDMRNRSGHAFLMLVACDSLSNQARVDQLEAEGQLFSTNTPNGLIPGESAAIVLAAPPAQLTPENVPLASIARSAWGERQSPLTPRGRSDAELLCRILPDLLQQAGTQAGEIDCLSSDCDQRSALFTEAALLMNSLLQALDPVSDHLALGRSFGHTGHAGPLLALVTAAHAAHERGRAVLAASMVDPVQRSLAVLLPWQVSAS